MNIVLHKMGNVANPLHIVANPFTCGVSMHMWQIHCTCGESNGFATHSTFYYINWSMDSPPHLHIMDTPHVQWIRHMCNGYATCAMDTPPCAARNLLHSNGYATMCNMDSPNVQWISSFVIPPLNLCLTVLQYQRANSDINNNH